jgi:hypothetical protein
MIERNLLDQTKDLRPPQRDVQSNFGMEGAKTDSGARMSQQPQNNELAVWVCQLIHTEIGWLDFQAACQDKTMRTLNYFLSAASG